MKDLKLVVLVIHFGTKMLQFPNCRYTMLSVITELQVYQYIFKNLKYRVSLNYQYLNTENTVDRIGIA